MKQRQESSLGILHPHSPEQLKEAAWDSTLENASRGLHVQLVDFWLYVKALTIGFFPSFVVSADPHSAECSPLWMGFVHIHKDFAELRPMALMIPACETRE